MSLSYTNTNSNYRLSKQLHDSEFKTKPKFITKQPYDTSYKLAYNIYNIELPSDRIKNTNNHKKTENSSIRVYKENYKSIDLSDVVSDRVIFHRLKRLELPNSKRIIETSLRPIEKDELKYRSISKTNHNNPGNFSSLMQKTNNYDSITKCRKASNPRVHSSINIMHQTPEENSVKRIIAHAHFKKYDTTTQIVALPGGEKRDKYSIKDDKKFIIKKNEGHLLKIKRDFNSSVGEILNTQSSEVSTKLSINDLQEKSNNYNLFMKSSKIDPKTFGKSSESKENPIFFRKSRPTNIKNLFESQITIS